MILVNFRDGEIKKSAQWPTLEKVVNRPQVENSEENVLKIA